MATIAIGDIHGHLKPLCDLLERVRPNVGADDTVVFLGDYIDRGSDTRRCIDAILEFTATVNARVVCLRGNHEDWFLRTMHDYTQHAWLLGMEAGETIRSYAPDAAEAIRAAARASRTSVYEGTCALPYELFFDALPPAHLQFFESLGLCHETPECFCSHGGVDPAAASGDTAARTLVWGTSGFPADYAGDRIVIYGHMNNAHVDDDDWPHPRVVGNTYGLDTIAHGVLSAVRLPGPYVLQSARYQRRRQRDRI
jgi:serine/threonine protein phosphatase 1